MNEDIVFGLFVLFLVLLRTLPPPCSCDGAIEADVLVYLSPLLRCSFCTSQVYSSTTLRRQRGGAVGDDV